MPPLMTHVAPDGVSVVFADNVVWQFPEARSWRRDDDDLLLYGQDADTTPIVAHLRWSSVKIVRLRRPDR